jgi:hypothetical protein
MLGPSRCQAIRLMVKQRTGLRCALKEPALRRATQKNECWQPRKLSPASVSSSMTRKSGGRSSEEIMLCYGKMAVQIVSF